MVKVILKKVSPFSVAKIQALLMGIFGLLIGIIMTIVSLFVKIPSWGYSSIIIFPAIYLISGFICGLIGAWIYNLCSSIIGGIELEMDEE